MNFNNSISIFKEKFDNEEKEKKKFDNEEKKSRDERSGGCGRMFLEHEYTNMAYYMSIKEPSLSQYYDKLVKIPPDNGWQTVFCLNVRDANTCADFIARYEERFGKL